MQKRSVIWFVQFIQQEHRQRAELLALYGLEVTFFSEVNALENYLKRARVSLSLLVTSLAHLRWFGKISCPLCKFRRSIAQERF